MRAGFRKIALIGGSGKVGRYIPEYAAAQGLQVRMLIRNPAKVSYADSRIELIQGDAQNRESLLETLQGCDVVVNTLGQPEREPNPIYSKVTAELVSVMQELDIQRYMGVTGGSLTLEGDRKSLLDRIGARMFRLLYPVMMEDKAREVRVLQASSLD
ncbi:NAD(P)-dependent oxidoreductase [Paenibacillus sp. CAA11]|uniref:NAD(P)-dependent oxidoreductase n=1 Tax=Paenibacillus sp. CAA11 TaxID=1532905 RepID=UPI001F29A644|nr:NAD(P)H-binding protein [Paenibacillus sp. CAA11]